MVYAYLSELAFLSQADLLQESLLLLIFFLFSNVTLIQQSINIIRRSLRSVDSYIA